MATSAKDLEMKLLERVRSRHAIVLVFVLACGVLTACGSNSSSANNGTSVNFSGTITVWHDWAGAYLTAKQKIAQAYMTLHPGVTIKLVNRRSSSCSPRRRSASRPAARSC